MSDPICFIDGEFVPLSQARVPVTDLGFLRAYAFFEAFRTYQGKFWHIDAHLDRLEKTAQTLLIDLPYERAWLHNLIEEVRLRNPSLAECAVRVIVTGGDSEDLFLPASTPRLVILARKPPRLPHEEPSLMARVQTVPFARSHPESKTHAYTFAVSAKLVVMRSGYEYVLYTSPCGELLESTTLNFFAVKEGVLHTVDAQVLPGITRAHVCALAKRLAIPLSHVPLTLADLPYITEAFFTSSLQLIKPISCINTWTYPLGPITTRLMDELYCELGLLSLQT